MGTHEPEMMLALRACLAGIVLGSSGTSQQCPAFSISMQLYPGLLRICAASLTALTVFSAVCDVCGSGSWQIQSMPLDCS